MRTFDHLVGEMLFSYKIFGQEFRLIQVLSPLGDSIPLERVADASKTASAALVTEGFGPVTITQRSTLSVRIARKLYYLDDVGDGQNLFAPASAGEVFYESEGGEWRTSGGEDTFFRHSRTAFVEMENGEVRFVRG